VATAVGGAVVGGVLVAGAVVGGVVVLVTSVGSVVDGAAVVADGTADDVVTVEVSGAADPLGSPALPHAAAMSTMASRAIVGLIMELSGMDLVG